MRTTVRTLLVMCAIALPASMSASSTPLAVVPSVDYARYSGTWFEIARLPNRFQAMCAGDVTATYVQRPEPASAQRWTSAGSGTDVRAPRQALDSTPSQ